MRSVTTQIKRTLMKNSSLALLLILIFTIGTNKALSQTKKLPKIAIAGLATESSTFSPALAARDAFRIRKGKAVLETYPFMVPDSMVVSRAEWLPALVAGASPGGAVTREAYESLVEETLDSLRKNGPYDGLYYDIHGAMSVVGLDDPEGDMLVRIREVVGTETLISTSMDLHGNVSWRLAKHTDLITCFRMAPHEDRWETKKRAVENLLDRLENGKGKPAYKAWVPVPILLPGEKTSTRVEPAKSLYDKIPAVTEQSGVIDAAIWIGYAWADEPRNHGVVMVTGDDRQQVSSAAEKLANSFWDVRSQFGFVAPVDSLAGSLKKALKSKKHPFFISDSGDNPTAGGAGDVTWTLQKLLERPEFKPKNGPSLIYASIPGPELFQEAQKLGIGQEISGHVGGKIDGRFAPPLEIKGTIEGLSDRATVVRVGSLRIIVSSDRNRKTGFDELGLDPLKTDIIVVKMGYLVPDLYNMRQDWIMALTPGGVDQDIESLDYKRINRPMFPFDTHLMPPDLSARLIPASDEFVPESKF